MLSLAWAALRGDARQEAGLVDLEALVRALHDALGLVVAFSVEHNEPPRRPAERGADRRAHADGRGGQVADVDPCPHGSGPGRELGLDGADRGELEEAPQPARG